MPLLNFMGEDFFTISDVLNEKIFDFKKGQNALKHSTIFSFWGQIVGKKFEKCTKPYSIKGSKLYVTCENSFVLQELQFHKSLLIKKIKPYSEPLGIIISDLVLDYKNWEANNSNFEFGDNAVNFYDMNKVDSVKIDEKMFENVFLEIDKSEFLSDEQKEKFKTRILRLEKAKKLRD